MNAARRGRIGRQERRGGSRASAVAQSDRVVTFRQFSSYFVTKKWREKSRHLFSLKL